MAARTRRQPGAVVTRIPPTQTLSLAGHHIAAPRGLSASMEQLLYSLFDNLEQEIVGLFGGAIFLGSWILQAWESRRAGQPVVSTRFFLIRALACALLTYEGLRTGSLSVVIVMVATGVLMLYNVVLILRGRRASIAPRQGASSSPETAD